MKRNITLFLLLILGGLSSLQAQTLVHYWAFNTSTDQSTLLTPDVQVVSGSSITYTAGGTPASVLEIPGTGQNFNVTNPNTRNSTASGDHLRLNNAVGASLEFNLPTTGYQNVIVKYGTRRSGSGAQNQIIHYSVDGTNYLPLSAVNPVNPVNGNPATVTLDFSSITAANNNANFKIRITFELGTATLNEGNNRFDNFTLDADPLAIDETAPTATFNPLNNAIDVATSENPTITFNENVRLISDAVIDNTNVDALVELKLNSK